MSLSFAAKWRLSVQNNHRPIAIRKVDETTPAYQRDGFIEAYRAAFGGEPYFEAYTYEQVLDDTWLSHRECGTIFLALDGVRVAGFGCAKPLDRTTDETCEFIRGHKAGGAFPGELSATCYMTEVGVLDVYRHRGLGYRLTYERLRWAHQHKMPHYAMRTAKKGSNSIQMYKNIGAVELLGAMDISDSAQATVNKSQSLERVCLWGYCSSGIAAIEARLKAHN